MMRITFDESIPPVTEVKPPAPVGYLLYVKPRAARETLGSGLLVAAKRTQDAEQAIATIGQVIAMGSQAKKVRVGNLDPTADPVSQGITVGSWLHYRQHAGQKLRIRKTHDEDDGGRGEVILALSDEDILGVFDDEAHAARFYDWLA